MSWHALSGRRWIWFLSSVRKCLFACLFTWRLSNALKPLRRPPRPTHDITHLLLLSPCIQYYCRLGPNAPDCIQNLYRYHRVSTYLLCEGVEKTTMWVYNISRFYNYKISRLCLRIVWFAGTSELHFGGCSVARYSSKLLVERNQNTPFIWTPIGTILRSVYYSCVTDLTVAIKL